MLNMNGPGFWIMYIVLLGGMMYVMAIRPQKKEKKRLQELLSSIAVGDYVLTSGGFYGVIVAITEDTVIIEFGGDKHCRIPMKREAIIEIEKPAM